MKILKTLTVLILLLTLIITALYPLLANYIGPRCYNMVWGVVWNGEDGMKDVNVEFSIVRIAQELETKTNSSGVYAFYTFTDWSGYVNINTDGAGGKTVYMKRDIAIRQDFYVGDWLHPPEQRESPIVYITEYGSAYHNYGCQYLWDSCKPVALEYILLTGSWEACEICWK